jgi:hypothetical protein
MSVAAGNLGNAFKPYRIVMLCEWISENIGGVTGGADAPDGVALSGAVRHIGVTHAVTQSLVWLAVGTAAIVGLHCALRNLLMAFFLHQSKALLARYAFALRVLLRTWLSATGRRWRWRRCYRNHSMFSCRDC